METRGAGFCEPVCICALDGRPRRPPAPARPSGPLARPAAAPPATAGMPVAVKHTMIRGTCRSCALRAPLARPSPRAAAARRVRENVPIRIDSYRLVPAGTRWYRLVLVCTGPYRIVPILLGVIAFTARCYDFPAIGTRVFRAWPARLHAEPVEAFARPVLAFSASTRGAQRPSLPRPFEHRTAARARTFRVTTPTPLWLSNSSGAHRAPSVLTGDVQRLRAQRRANSLPFRPNPRPCRQ